MLFNVLHIAVSTTMSNMGSQQHFLPSVRGNKNNRSQERYSRENERSELKRQSIPHSRSPYFKDHSRSSYSKDQSRSSDYSRNFYSQDHSYTPPFQRLGGPNVSNISFNENSFFTSTNYRQDFGKRNKVYYTRNQISELDGSYISLRKSPRKGNYAHEKEGSMYTWKNSSHEGRSQEKIQDRGRNKYGKRTRRAGSRSSTQERNSQSCSYTNPNSYPNLCSWYRNSSKKYDSNPIHAKSQSFAIDSQKSLKSFGDQNKERENSSSKPSTNLPERKKRMCRGEYKAKQRSLVHEKNSHKSSESHSSKSLKNDSLQKKSIPESHSKSGSIIADSANISDVQDSSPYKKMLEKIELSIDLQASLNIFDNKSERERKRPGDDNKSKQRSLVQGKDSHKSSEPHSSKSLENDSLQKKTIPESQSKSGNISADSANISGVQTPLSNDKISEKIEFTIDSQESLKEFVSQSGNEKSKSKYVAKRNLVFPLTQSFNPDEDHTKNASHKLSETTPGDKLIIPPILKSQSNETESSSIESKMHQTTEPTGMKLNENDKSSINSLLLYPASIEDDFTKEDIDIPENSFKIDQNSPQTPKEDKKPSCGKFFEKTSKDINEIEPSIENSNKISTSLEQQEDISKNSNYLSITPHEKVPSPSFPCAQPPSCSKPEKEVDPLCEFISEMVSPSLPSPQQASIEPYQPTLYSSQKFSLDANFEREKDEVTQNNKTVNSFLDILPPSDQTFSLTLGQRNPNPIENLIHQKIDTSQNIMPSCPSTPTNQLNNDLCHNTSKLPNYLSSSFFENETETKELKIEIEPLEKNISTPMPIQSLFSDQPLLSDNELIPCTPGSNSSLIPSIHSLKSFLHSNANSITSTNSVNNESHFQRSIFQESDSSSDFPSLLKRLSPHSIEWHESSKNPMTSTQYSQKVKHFPIPEISPLRTGVDLEFSSSAGFFAKMPNLNGENEQDDNLINSIIPNTSVNPILHSDVPLSSEINNNTHDASSESISHVVKPKLELIYDDSNPECRLGELATSLVPNVPQNHVDAHVESICKKKVQFEIQQSSDSQSNMVPHSTQLKKEKKRKPKKQKVNSSVILSTKDNLKVSKDDNFESIDNGDLLKENNDHNLESKSNEDLLKESKDHKFECEVNSALEKLKNLLLKRKLYYEKKGISNFDFLVKENDECSMDISSNESSGINQLKKDDKRLSLVVSLEVVPKRQTNTIAKKCPKAKKIKSNGICMDTAFFAGENWWDTFLDPLPELDCKSSVKPKVKSIISDKLVVDSSEESTKSKKKKNKMSKKSKTAESYLEDSLSPPEQIKKKKVKSTKFVNISVSSPKKFVNEPIKNSVHSKNPIILSEEDELTKIGEIIFSHNKNKMSENNNFKSFQCLEKNISPNHEIREIANLESNKIKKKSKTVTQSPTSTTSNVASVKSTSNNCALKIKRKSINGITKNCATKVNYNDDGDIVCLSSSVGKSCHIIPSKNKKLKKKNIKKLGAQTLTPPYAFQKTPSTHRKKRKLMSVTKNYLESNCMWISD